MKVFYFNDTNKIQQVFLHSLMKAVAALNPATGTWVDLGMLQEDQAVFVKVWGHGHVLIGRTDIGSQPEDEPLRGQKG